MADATYNLFLDGRRLEAGLLALLSRIEVRESDSDATVLALRFKVAQQPSGEFTPIDDGILRPAVPLALDLAAPGGNPIRLFEGFVTHVRPHFEPIESNCYVEVLAMDAAVLLDSEERVATYPDSTDAEAAETVFSRYHIRFEGRATPARHEERKQLLVQRATDWQFVRRLARRNGFACYLEPDGNGGAVAHFRPPAVDESAQADLTILRDEANLRWVDVQYLAAGPVRRTGAAIDPVAKRIVRAGGETRLPALGDTAVADDVEQGLKDAGANAALALLHDPAPLDTAIEAQGSAGSERAQFAVEARGELDPALYRGLLRARRPVLLKGVGRLFAGAYYVKAVRTVIDEGALAQTFVAERNALGLSGREAFGQSAEEMEA